MCGIAENTRAEDYSAGEVALLYQALAERLHDGPLQQLVALQLKAANLVRLDKLSLDEQLERLAELGSLAQTAIDQLHHVIHDLTSDGDEPVDLPTRLKEVCNEFEIEYGVACDLQIDPEHLRFPPTIADVVYRSITELLTNVRTHARATMVRIASRQRRDGAIVISVADNGVGMRGKNQRTNPFQSGGVGLWSIEQRLREFGGSLSVDGEAGVVVTLVVPRAAGST